MQDRQRHQPEVEAFLQAHISNHHWNFRRPKGTGGETYVAHGRDRTYFVKLGVQLARYQGMASISLTPDIVAAGYLEDGTSIMVQQYIAGRSPTPEDFQIYLEQIARTIDRFHHNPKLKQILPVTPSELYSEVGLMRLQQIQDRWSCFRTQVLDVADFIDESIETLRQQVQRFAGAGLVASHNDICNANWLISPDGKIYLIDIESMTLDDPACDLGAILWWYYPPALRPKFLEIVGYANDESFLFRMRVRMAMHCLHILLPREKSFDNFQPATFSESLIDFRAVLAGEENPQGY